MEVGRVCEGSVAVVWLEKHGDGNVYAKVLYYY